MEDESYAHSEHSAFSPHAALLRVSVQLVSSIFVTPADDWLSDDVDWDELIIRMMLMTMVGERMSVRMLMRRRRTMKMMRMSVRMLMMMVR